ncbi:MAG: TldD/PmbA family protein [Euryarchaeota archaeon]|nr:TldD/PmbA family protein [Euryarchaeota archaeon]MDE2046600.1 TldD/PmbA family protein [Thermoplasmata archaeon]
MKNGTAEALTSSSEAGIGVRVLRERGWGFAAASEASLAAARETAKRAERLARAAEKTSRESVPFAEERELPRGGRYESPMKEDPFSVTTEAKIALLKEAEARLHTHASVKAGKAALTLWQEEKWYLSNEGASYRAKITHVGAGVEATAVGEGEVQRRSYPNSFGGDFAQAGFEFLRGLDLPSHAEECGKTAHALLTAPACPKGEMDLVLASDQLALQVHESVGHATELDRVLAFEAGFAGTSFVSVSELGKLRYGSPAMTIEADATCPGGLGTFAWDDEGVPGRRYPLVREGVLTGFLSSRETAARVGLPESGGTARADGWARTPLIRMTNVNLAPGERSRGELLEGVKEGVYMETNRSWSIDDKRLNFQFGCEVGRSIKNGELGGLLRNTIYSGMTPTFWNSLVATSDRSTWHLWGLPNCGKGQPGQVGHVGHGAPLGLFRKVRVGGGP